jgi:hypothetical protein
MPRETIEIVLTELDPYQSGALFLATVAYPDSTLVKERNRFSQALVRWTLEWRIDHDEKWSQDYQVLRPAYFSGDEKQYANTLKRGTKQLNFALTAAQFMAMPHLRKIDTGYLENVESLEPMVYNMSILAADHLGWGPGSYSNFKANAWGPSKPVIHAAAAYVVWQQVLWEKWGRNPKANKNLAFLMLPEYVKEVVAISEEFRAQLKEITQFKIRDEETIQFTTVRSPNSDVFMQLRRDGDA